MRKNPSYTDRELVEGCLRNDRSYQERLYRRFFNPMMHMCMRYTSDRDKAMHIVNDGFLRVFKKIGRYGFKGSLEGWIRKLVFHSLSDYFQKHSKYVQFLVFEERDSTIQSNALQKLFVEDILKMIDTLPPATKEVFQLYALDGFTHVEIARQLDISVGTSKWHLSNARKKLKDLINHYQIQGINKHAG